MSFTGADEALEVLTLEGLGVLDLLFPPFFFFLLDLDLVLGVEVGEVGVELL